MNANWLVPVFFAAWGLYGARVLVLYFSGVPMDAMGPVYALWLSVIGFVLAGVAVRELWRRRGDEGNASAAESSGKSRTLE